jgi:hypothetical protein
MARYRYSPAPSPHGPEEIDVTTIPVPDEWRADPPAPGNRPGDLALTDTALDHLVDALARRRVVDLPEDLSPYGMVALLDAAWDREQPWRELVEERLRNPGRPHRDFQQHLYALQEWWDRAWMSRHGDYMAWLTDGTVTDDMVERWEDWMNEQADRHFRIQTNPGRLSVEQIAQLTRVAIQQVARDPGDRWLDDIIEDVLPLVEADVAALPAQPDAGDPQATPPDVVTEMVQEYLHARRGAGWPAGRASAWAVGSVVDQARTLDEAASAHELGAFDVDNELRSDLDGRTDAAMAASEDQSTEPWLRSDVGSLLAMMPSDTIPTELIEQARVVSTTELLARVEQARVPSERPLELKVALMQDAAERARSHLEEEKLVLQGLRQQSGETGPWWRPSTWTQRANLNARIVERQRLVTELGKQLHHTQEKLAELLPASRVAVHAWQAQQQLRLGRAVAAVQELQLREQGLLDDRVADPPNYLVETLGPPPPEEAGRQAWQAQALQLERARAAGLAIDGVAAWTAASVTPPTLSGREEDRAAAGAWIVARDRAGWPVDPPVRGYALGDGPPVGQPVTDGGTLAKCDPFGIPSTSHWTGAAIIVQSPRTKTCIVTRSRTSIRPMPFSLAG